MAQKGKKYLTIVTNRDLSGTSGCSKLRIWFPWQMVQLAISFIMRVSNFSQGTLAILLRINYKYGNKNTYPDW